VISSAAGHGYLSFKITAKEAASNINTSTAHLTLDGLQVKVSMLKDILSVSVCIKRILPLKKITQANYAWPLLYTEVGIHPLPDNNSKM
jgi:hypothetical protein